MPESVAHSPEEEAPEALPTPPTSEPQLVPEPGKVEEKVEPTEPKVEQTKAEEPVDPYVHFGKRLGCIGLHLFTYISRRPYR